MSSVYGANRGFCQWPGKDIRRWAVRVAVRVIERDSEP